MEDDNELEQVTGSPTAGENGFVHIESVDSAQMDGGLIDQVENLEQDDGVVVTGVEDTVQDEPLSVRTTDDVAPDEFVDCPDDLLSNEGRSPGVPNRAHQLPFGRITENTQHTQPEIEIEREREREILPHDNQEEKGDLIKEVSNLHHLLKSLSKQHTLTDGTDVLEGGEKSLHELVNECSKFVEISLNEQSHVEATISELNATLHMKDKEIEDLIVRVNVNDNSISQEIALKSDELASINTIVDRILYSLTPAFGDSGLSDTSVSERLSYLERSTLFLLEKYHTFLSEIQTLSHCLVEVKPDFNVQNGTETVFVTVKEELLELKRKELELTEKNSHLEYQYPQFMEQIEKNRETIEVLNTEITKLKGEVEQEKIRYTNTKEKLSMAVTKGKALVQQRDSLKQSVSEKTSELEKCLTELQEKSTALEASELKNIELMQTAYLANSLQEALSQRDMILQRCGEVLMLSGVQSSDIIEGVTWLANERSRITYALSSLGLSEVTQSFNLESQVIWLLESYNLVKDQSVKLQDQNYATMESARVQIDRLTASLLQESQEKFFLKHEYEDLKMKEQEIASTEVLEKIQNLLYVRDLESNIYEQILEEEKMCRFQTLKVSEELNASKDEKNLLQVNLQRSEEKGSLLREKLSMAVKKGKGLVQERETMKQQMAEKNTQIETLTLELKKQESTLSEYMNQINILSTELNNFSGLKEERDQIEQYLYQSNTMLQQVLETINDVILPVDIIEPVEKVKWLATYFSESEVTKAQVEQELEYIKHEAGMLTGKLTEALTTMKSLEYAVSVSERNLSQIAEEKRELEVSKINSEQEVKILNEEVSTLNKKLVEVMTNLKSLEDTVSNSEKTITQITKEKGHVEDELHKVMEKTNKFQEALSLAENNISVLVTEKEEAHVSKVASEMELDKVKEEVSEAYKTIKSLEDAMSDLKSNVSQFSQENEKALDSRSILQTEIQKLKEEAVDASVTIKTLEDTVSDNVVEKKKAEEDILALKTELNTCKQELSELLGNLQVLLKDGSLFSLFKESFEKKIENLKEIDSVLKDIKGSFDSKLLQDHPSIEESLQLNDWNIEFNVQDSEGIGSDVLDNLNSRNKNLEDQFGSFSTMIDDMIESLLKKVDVIRNTMPIKELEGEIEKVRSMYDKVKEENEAYHGRMFKLEKDLEASGNMCKEMSSKLADYQEKENKWNEREKEDTKNGILSASQINTLFNKIDGIPIPFPNLLMQEEIHPQDSNHVQKLFYIVDSVNELLDQITLLSHSKEDILSRQTLELEHLKEELSVGLQTIIQKLGGGEESSVGVKKSGDVAGLVPVLERVVDGFVLDGENSRFKLMESQRVKEELGNRVKLLEEYIENQTEKIQERRIFEPPSLPAGSEISEIEDQTPVGKVGLPLVPSAAQVRSLRKGSNEQLAITIDSESDRLLNNKDKGHMFKSLNTSGLVPVKGKMFADRLDGIWVSGDRALMSRPRARLGLIAYWLVLHLWVLGTIL